MKKKIKSLIKKILNTRLFLVAKLWASKAAGKLIEDQLDKSQVSVLNQITILNDPDFRQNLESVLRRLVPNEFPAWQPYLSSMMGSLARFSPKDKDAPFNLQRSLLDILAPSPARAPSAKTTPGKKLKILYVTGMFPSLEHAGGLRLFDIISHLSKRHEVDLYSSFTPALDEKSLNALRPSLHRFSLVEFDSFKYELESWFMKENIQGAHYDVIQFEYPQSVDLLHVAKKYGRRTGFTMMECMTRSKVMDVSRWVKGAGFEISPTVHEMIQMAHVETLGLRGSDFSIAVTEADAKFAEQMSGVRPLVLGSGISEYAFPQSSLAQSPSTNPKTAAFVGFYDHPPNVDAMLWYIKNVHPLVKAKVPEYQLEVIGRGRTDRIAHLAAGDPSVKITGRVEDIAAKISKASICLSPLISGAGFRGKINQYSICGKPTVSTSIGVSGLPYVHGKSALIADDSRDFAEQVILLLTQPEVYERIRAGAKQVIDEHFNWEKIIPRLESIYYGNES